MKNSENSEMLNSLDSISSSITYSKNGHLFEKMLSHRSLKTLIKKLKYPIKIKKMSFIEEFKSKYPYDSTTLGIQDEYFSDTIYNIYNIRSKKKNEKKKNPDKKNHILFNKEKYNILNKKKNFDYINDNPFKYNPNYNSIYKNIPTTKFYLPSKECLQAKNKKEEKNKNKFNKNFLLTNLFHDNNKKQLIIKLYNNINEGNIFKNDFINEKFLSNNKQILTPINYNSKSINYFPNIN